MLYLRKYLLIVLFPVLFLLTGCYSNQAEKYFKNAETLNQTIPTIEKNILSIENQYKNLNSINEDLLIKIEQLNLKIKDLTFTIESLNLKANQILEISANTEQSTDIEKKEVKKVKESSKETLNNKNIKEKQNNSYTGRCQATTKKGKQCKRSAKAGSNFCYQHGG